MKKQLTTKQVLTRARKLIEKGWTRKALARNKYRHEVQVDSPSACKFCAIGAVARVTGFDAEAYRPALYALSSVINFSGLATFNDTHTKQAVLDLYSKAIELCS